MVSENVVATSPDITMIVDPLSKTVGKTMEPIERTLKSVKKLISVSVTSFGTLGDLGMRRKSIFGM